MTGAYHFPMPMGWLVWYPPKGRSALFIRVNLKSWALRRQSLVCCSARLSLRLWASLTTSMLCYSSAKQGLLMLLFSHLNSTLQAFIKIEMFLFGQYIHTSACCKMAQSSLGLPRIFLSRELALLFPQPSELPNNGKYSQLKVQLLQRCLSDLGAQVLLIFNEAFVPTSHGHKQWFHHSCLPLYLCLIVFLIHSFVYSHSSQGAQNKEHKNNHGHMQTNPHWSKNRYKFQKRLSLAPRPLKRFESNTPPIFLPSPGFICALGDDSVTGPYCKSDSLWIGSITLALKVTSHSSLLTASDS